ncbi:ankyrin repeat and sterile alpha motif domain-containing protein 1B [Stomoxys calcitrans]|uniref:ankyrin repeat and sterile alpha motif domain-containing protein 1B n=1 Tax=Stomoxys calcitrans TaxID=35570 RepID=UPI0027E36B2F|nr:ankyrin repeat and sterile alpha motif domain-containing protein 1B [Stomoxys calcitrans]
MGKDQEFLEAARNGNISHIEKVLNAKAKRAGPLASLRRGTGVNVQDSGGYSALHHACLNGHTDIVRLLLSHEASPNLPDMRGSSPLHLAAWAGEEEIVKLLLTHPYRPANPDLQTIEKETPLHCAAQHGHTGALSILLAHEADPNMRNTRGETPLDLACQYGRLQAVQILIRAHPELIAPYTVQATENQGNNRSRHSSPLPNSGSMSTPSPSSPSVLSSPATPIRCVFPHTCLHLASRNGHKPVVEVLLNSGVNVNLLTPSGSALHEAALCGKETVVRTLLKAGIDLNATDSEERTVLDILKEFPPHVTKHIIDVINNFRNQMDTDDGEEVIYRHQQSSNTTLQRNHHQKQQHNNHYHFNSNNHLLNHSLSMQQSSYNKQRFSSGATFNGGGKSLDSGLQLDETSSSTGTGGGGGGNRFYHDTLNSPVRSQSNTSQNEMGISPSSSMSSFEPSSVSPRSRCSTGGVSSFVANTPMLSSFGPAAPPKKPPRRNLSVSPTNSGQPFSYTSPNHQQQGTHGRRQARSPSNDSPYSHQSHSSVGGMSFDETQLSERQRGSRLFASARETTRSSAGISLSSSTDMLEKRHHTGDIENLVPNSNQDITNSMKRPKPAPRNLNSVTSDTIKSDNPTLKSYNPNRKLKRNRNSYSITLGDNDDGENAHKPQTPQSPTNYKQPPTPDHPPPSSSHAEKVIHERIRPLSQEYKRRSALLQLQKQQQLLIDMATSPLRQLNSNAKPTSHYDYAYIQPNAANLDAISSNIYSTIGSGAARGSMASLSSSISLSDHSGSTDNVEEFVGDQPLAGLMKGSSAAINNKQKVEPAYATVNKASKINPPQVQLPPPRPQQQLPPQTQVPVYATIHKKRGISTTAHSSSTEQTAPKPRPPIPAKPVIPERRLFKTPVPQVPASEEQPSNRDSMTTIETTNALDLDHEMTNDSDDLYEELNEPKTVVENNIPKTPNSSAATENKDVTTKPAGSSTNDILSHQSSINSSSNEEQSQTTQTSSQPTTESSNEDSSTTNNNSTSTTSHESSILSPFNAEEARKKISEILESFGSSILNSDISPTNDLDFDDTEVPVERQELVSRLRRAGLGPLEKKLLDQGYDNYKFMNGVLEESDLEAMSISKTDGAKLLRFIATLPKAEFPPQVPLKNQQENKSSGELKGVSSLNQWLNTIQLPQYIESFNKHLYNTLDSVCGVWDVELQTVLEINKLGHRRRILQSIAFIKQMREPKSAKTPLGENNETNKIPASGGGGGGQRQSITSYRKNRPAPQPPTQKATQQTPTSTQSLEIRAPSELLLGLPDNLRTKWRHSANDLLNDQIKYEVYYLGSTVVKELRGTESTRKSIQKLKQDAQHTTATNMLMSSQSETNAARNQSFNKQKRILVALAISHHGVEFLDVNTKNTICEHEIQNINCACQDSDDLRHFAYITKENDVHYCHVFYVESLDLASDIILTIGQAFEVAYQLALRDGISSTPLSTLNHSILQGLDYSKQTASASNSKTQEA